MRTFLYCITVPTWTVNEKFYNDLYKEQRLSETLRKANELFTSSYDCSSCPKGIYKENKFYFHSMLNREKNLVTPLPPYTGSLYELFSPSFLLGVKTREEYYFNNNCYSHLDNYEELINCIKDHHIHSRHPFRHLSMFISLKAFQLFVTYYIAKKYWPNDISTQRLFIISVELIMQSHLILLREWDSHINFYKAVFDENRTLMIMSNIEPIKQIINASPQPWYREIIMGDRTIYGARRRSNYTHCISRKHLENPKMFYDSNTEILNCLKESDKKYQREQQFWSLAGTGTIIATSIILSKALSNQ